jgi:hypothetical protein
MRDALSRMATFAWDNLGSCSVCMARAFQVAIAGWGVTLLLVILGWSQLLLLTFVGAIALTALWIAHLLVHARKVTILPENRNVIQPAVGVSRRAVLPLFVRTLWAAAVLSATPAFAQVECPGGTGACGGYQPNDPLPCGDCYRPCYNGPTPCIRCRSCGNSCGENIC